MAVMYGFWASSCSWRVRAALHLKKIPFEERSVDIVKEMSQHTDKYRVINPSQKVPALVIDGVTLVESMAIIQYLEDTRPEPPLMPKTPLLRAQAREICETIVSGIQPLQNIGLKPHFETNEHFLNFAKHWTKRGLQSLDNLLEKSAGKCCVGDEICIADLCFVPQIYNSITRYDSSEMFKTQKKEKTTTQTWRQMITEKYPTVSNVYDNLLQEEIFTATHPKTIRCQARIHRCRHGGHAHNPNNL